MSNTKLIVGIIIGILIGFAIFWTSGFFRTEPYYMPHYMREYPHNQHFDTYPEYNLSNGARIYYTGVNEKGEPIPFELGPPWLYMHGGSCVNCHGERGEGGVVVMHCGKVAPKITYKALTEGEHEGHMYTEEDIKRAIREGIEPDGEELDPCMPRWKMSDEDLNDLVEFLKTL